MQYLRKSAILFAIGALVYFEIELNWRYFVNHLPVHWTMPIVGAIMFLAIGGINEIFTFDMAFEVQSIIGGIVITVTEFLSGLLLNIMLGLDVWDYTHLPFNVLGQICLPFTLAWFFLAAIAIVVDDYIRYKLFHEEFPHYCFAFIKRKE